MKIGAQLYTVTKSCQTLEDLSETLKRVSDMGYTSVQLSAVCKYEPEWMREQLDKCGLEAPITHYDSASIANATDDVIDFHKRLGAKYVGLGGMPGLWNADYKEKPFEYWNNFVKNYVPAAEKIRDAGLYFMYHNHHYEFQDVEGKILFDYILENFPSDIMGFTADVYWFKAAGRDPVKTLESLAGRIPVVHFKDMVTLEDGTQHYAPVGHGELDFDGMIEVCKKSNVEYVMVEQDDCYGEDPFECLKKSYDYLYSKGLR